ncbi:MAG: anti-sigma F factor, partial [Clostridia bacterium]
MKSKPVNKFKCTFAAKSVNEGFSRMLVASFVSQLDPRVNEGADIKTAVSEAVTNSIVHG